MSMCFKHNRYYRVGQCPLCIKEIEDQLQLEHEIRMLEKENAEIELALWKGR